MLPYKVTICGLSELSEVVPSGISHVISILDPDYPYPSELKIIDSSRRELFSFEDVVVPEESQKIPERADIKRLLDWGRGLLLGGEETHLLVHCHAGFRALQPQRQFLCWDRIRVLRSGCFRKFPASGLAIGPIAGWWKLQMNCLVAKADLLQSLRGTMLVPQFKTQNWPS